MKGRPHEQIRILHPPAQAGRAFWQEPVRTSGAGHRGHTGRGGRAALATPRQRACTGPQRDRRGHVSGQGNRLQLVQG